jgi:hypothetical protein
MNSVRDFPTASAAASMRARVFGSMRRLTVAERARDLVFKVSVELLMDFPGIEVAFA